MLETALTKTEIDERVAILHRLRDLLEQQRKKFQDYLAVLEKQEAVIEAEDGETLVAQTELEQHIVSGISHLQRVIEPIETLYRDTHVDAENHLPVLKTDLHILQQKVLNQNSKNRDLLRVHLEGIRAQLARFRNPYHARQSVYASDVHSASVIDVTG